MTQLITHKNVKKTFFQNVFTHLRQRRWSRWSLCMHTDSVMNSVRTSVTGERKAYPTGRANGFGFQFRHEGSSVLGWHRSDDVDQTWLCWESIFRWGLCLQPAKKCNTSSGSGLPQAKGECTFLSSPTDGSVFGFRLEQSFILVLINFVAAMTDFSTESKMGNSGCHCKTWTLMKNC